MSKHLIRTTADLPNNHWLSRDVPQGTSLRPYAEDRAVAVLTGAVLDAIENAGITRVELARLLGTTKSYVSQVLNGSTNMTLKTLGALMWAAGRQVQSLESAPMGAMARATQQRYYAAETDSEPPVRLTTYQPVIIPQNTYQVQ